jgi:NADH-quinone oxidoreductase subunit J
MTLELIIFLIVAAIAIFAAAFMLVSRNAVHAALFLVTNMICLAFCYLLLNAPFLAMVQITVYAGAIMVLFMFVIMLLGSDKLGEMPTKYKWLPVIGVGLASVFLVIAYWAIAQGNIGALKPVPKAPQVRAAHVGVSVPPLDVYLNGTPIVSGLAYQKVSDFTNKLKAGDYNLAVYATKADGTKIDPAKDAPVLAQAITLKDETVTTLVITADKVIVAPQNLSPLPDEATFRYTVVNALPEEGAVNLIAIDPTNPNPEEKDRDKYIKTLAPGLKYGDVSKTVELPLGNYDVAWEIKGQRVNVPENLNLKPNTTALVILYPEVVPGSNPVRSEPDDLNLVDRAELPFGGPSNIGEGLFTVYLLPFELVSLLLLVAMVGAIILTREETIRRERKRVVVSKGLHTRRLNQATATNAISLAETKPVQPNEGAAD